MKSTEVNRKNHNQCLDESSNLFVFGINPKISLTDKVVQDYANLAESRNSQDKVLGYVQVQSIDRFKLAQLKMDELV